MLTRRIHLPPSLFLVLICALPALVSGRGSPPDGDAGPVPAAAALQAGGNPRIAVPLSPPLSPMMQDIMDRWAETERTVQDLRARVADSRDVALILSLQREIEAVLIRTEIELLAIQAHHARLEGREDDALRIEAAIQEMTAPKPEPEPRDRPARPRPR
jgi:hypothetical protein